MKVLVFALLVVAASASLLEQVNVQFQEFKVQHGKNYKNTAEETKRFSIFNENLRSIEEHNALYEQGLVSYKKGINQFTDMTQEEIDAFLALSNKKPKLQSKLYVKSGAAVPDSVDWRTSGQITGVKNQRNCGGCWAFSLTGCIEAAHFRKTKQLISLSEQQLIDCAPAPNQGCDGGLLDYTYTYIKQKGLESEQRYPFIGYNSKCKYNASTVVAKVDGYVAIREKDEKALLEAVATVGPVSIAMQAKYLTSYSSGIYSDSKCNPDELDHAVLVVGYGSENGQDYWIVKNSWGPNWGEKGYFRIKRGVNECGVAEDCVYPTIK